MILRTAQYPSRADASTVKNVHLARCDIADPCAAQNARTRRVTELVTRLQAVVRGRLARQAYQRQRTAALRIQVRVSRNPTLAPLHPYAQRNHRTILSVSQHYMTWHTRARRWPVTIYALRSAMLLHDPPHSTSRVLANVTLALSSLSACMPGSCIWLFTMSLVRRGISELEARMDRRVILRRLHGGARKPDSG